MIPNDSQNLMGINTLNSAFNLQNTWAGSLARIGHEPPKLGVAGSSPAPPASVAVALSSPMSPFLSEARRRVVLCDWEENLHSVTVLSKICY